MNTSNFEWPVDKKPLYSLLSIRLRGLIDGIPHQISILANASALLGDALLNINWVGFLSDERRQTRSRSFPGQTCLY